MDGATVESSQPPQSQEATGNQPRATTQGTLVDEAARVAATLNDKLPTLSQETRLPGNHGSAAEGKREPPTPHDENKGASGAHAASHDALHSPDHAESATRAEDATAANVTPVAHADTRGGRIRQRAASVGENLRPRVEKLREASTVVFDEASDDPGLRFVIVAALLFLLFLFILLFSYILG